MFARTRISDVLCITWMCLSGCGNSNPTETNRTDASVSDTISDTTFNEHLSRIEGITLVKPSQGIFTFFGYTVVISGDGNTIAVANSDGTSIISMGNVVVYAREGDSWGEGVVLARPQNARAFGTSVAISSDGSTLVVGDSESRTSDADASWGAATVYTRSANVWDMGVTLERPFSSSRFGTSVDITSDGNTVVVGAPLGSLTSAGESTGTVTVFTKTTTSWSAGTNLTLAIPSEMRGFGKNVSFSEDANTILVGSARAHINGVDYLPQVAVYNNSMGSWNAGMLLPHPNDAQLFGASFGLTANGSTIVVGDPGAKNNEGAVTLFAKSSDHWISGTPLTRSNSMNAFGRSVAISSDGNTILTSSRGSPENNGVTLYTKTAEIWNASSTLALPEGDTYSAESMDMSSDGKTIVVGNPFGGMNGSGTVTVYAL